MSSQASAEVIRAGLRKLRWIRNLSHGPMAAFALLVLVEMLASPPISDSANRAANVVLPFAFAGFVLGFWLRRRRCPRCGLPFFQTRYRFASGRAWPVWNEFSSKCLNCGLHIDGRDA
jgi:hypothetical protein